MFAVTQIPTREEREIALAGVPHQAELRTYAGRLFGLLRNQSADFIDLAAAGHGRAALVAMQEGVDSLLQATFSLVESSLAEQVLLRQQPRDPLAHGEVLPEAESNERVRWRLVRCALEDAAVRTVSGVDHLVNAHLRLAWEANAATETEVKACGFDPGQPDPATWTSIAKLDRGLRPMGKSACLPAFRCTPAFEDWLRHASVDKVRTFRHQVVHRARPSHREAPSLGRRSLWGADGRASISINPFNRLPDESLPTLGERRDEIAEAIGAALPYADELWRTALLWLSLIGVHVDHQPDVGRISVKIGVADPRAVPRSSRDPGPFLTAESSGLRAH